MSENLYGLTVFWSHTDNEWICLCPDFPGLSAFGDTRAEAFKEGEIALGLMLDAYLKFNDEPPTVTRFESVKDALKNI